MFVRLQPRPEHPLSQTQWPQWAVQLDRPVMSSAATGGLKSSATLLNTAQRILRTKTVARGGREGAVWAPSHTHGAQWGRKRRVPLWGLEGEGANPAVLV